MPRLVSPLAAFPRGPPRRPRRTRQAGEDLLRLGEQARGLGQRLLRGEARLESVGQLGLDQVADALHGNTVNPRPAMATIPLLFVLAAAAQEPAARAREIAVRLPFAYRAYLELRREAGALGDPALRAAIARTAAITGIPAASPCIRWPVCSPRAGWRTSTGMCMASTSTPISSPPPPSGTTPSRRPRFPGVPTGPAGRNRGSRARRPTTSSGWRRASCGTSRMICST